jgi:hypothetical protein
VKAADSTINVTSAGIRVVVDQLPSSPVTSVNGEIGDVVLTASDVGALPTAGGTMTGDIVFASGQTFPGSVSQINTKTPDANGIVILDAPDVGAVPASGGTFTGDITVEGNITIPENQGVFNGDGSGLTNLNVPQAVRFKGVVSVASQTAPAAVAGDFYLNTPAGVAGVSWTGINGDNVLNDQFIFYTASNVWVKGGISDASSFVTLGTAQTITGVKTFSNFTSFGANVNVVGTVTAAALAGDGSQITNIDFPVDSVNGQTGDVVIDTSSINALPLSGGTMNTDGGNGIIFFVSNQTFPGTITSVNRAITPDADGDITLGATDVDAVSKRNGGTFQGEVKGVSTSSSSNAKSFVTKDYVDSQGGGGGGAVQSITAGNGLTGGVVDADNPTGVFAVLADGNSITVSAAGIKVNETNLQFPVTSVNGEVGTVVLDASDVGAIADVSGTYSGGLTGDTINLSAKATLGAALEVAGGTTLASNLTVSNGASTTTIAGQVFMQKNLQVVGTVTADSFIGDGSQLTHVVSSTTSVLPPLTPDVGDLWYNSVAGIMYVWYVDEDQRDSDGEGQWVDVRPPAAGGLVTSINGLTGAVTLSASSVGAIPTTGGIVTGTLNGTIFSGSTFKINSFPDDALPYVAADGTVSAMEGVTFDKTTKKITTTGSISSANITAFKTALTNAVTAAGDLASLKAAILSALGSL